MGTQSTEKQGWCAGFSASNAIGQYRTLKKYQVGLIACALISLILLLPSQAQTQGARHDFIVFGPTGRPVGRATITACTSAGAGIPCSPQATIYTDEALTIVAANPFQADSLGNAGFWASPGTYKISITGAGLTGSLSTVTLPCVAGSTTANCNSTGAANTWTATQTFSADPSILPSVVGKDLGSSTARWDAFIRDLDVSGIVTGVVPTSRTISTSTGLTGGGDLSADRTLSVVADSTIQRVEVAKNSGATVGTRKRLNLIEGSNVTLAVADDATGNEVDVTVAASGGGSYALQAFTVNSHSPADSTTYYFGMSDSANTLNSKRIPIPKTGRITRWDLQVRVDGLAGTTETVNFWVRLNDTTDNLNIQLSLNAAHVSGSATGSVNVTAGDFFSVKITTPAWVTNPTNVFYFATLYIEP